MKWPDDPDLPLNVRERLDARLTEFVEADPSPDGGKDGAAVQNLVLDLFAIYIRGTGGDEEEARQCNLIFTGMNWDTDNPRLAHAQKYINRLFSGRLSEAHSYIDTALAQRAEDDAAVGKAAIAAAGAQGGKTKNKAYAIAIEQALAYYMENRARYKNKKAAAADLEHRFPPVKFKTYRRLLSKV
ncbi:MAG: hypothetical protein RL753_891 [Bacteroidota bacterium]